ncbi:hypothetical protein ASZ90_011977 [hydrocarbon metagenome]|uniref:Uncharacterized protein n=1 Tax=hydrocarbon metagenome TaxID=938273 RepID=A0A0W8FBQ4_9ZZZZ
MLIASYSIVIEALFKEVAGAASSLVSDSESRCAISSSGNLDTLR